MARRTCGVCDQQTFGRKSGATHCHARPGRSWSLDVLFCGDEVVLVGAGVYLHVVPRPGEPVPSVRAGERMEFVVDVADFGTRSGVHVGYLRLMGLVSVLRPAEEEAQEVPLRARIPNVSPSAWVGLWGRRTQR